MSWRKAIRVQNERASPLFRAARSPKIAILLLLVTVTRAMGIPTNDNFSDRLAISGLTNTVAGSNVNATREPGEPNHAGNSGGNSIWWTWTAPTNATVILDTVGSSFDTLLAVYTGNSLDGLTPVASNDDRSEDRTSRVTFSSRAGTTYQIAVDGWNADHGDIRLNLQAVPAPPNDAFANRIVLSGYSNIVSGEITGATVEPGEPLYSGGRSVWWSWTAPAYGEVAVQAATRADGLVVSIYSGDSISNLVAHSSAIANYRFTFSAVQGITYHIAVVGDESSVGSFTLSMEQAWPATPFQIISQPQGAIMVQGYSWTFTVGVSGAGPLFFQWRKDGVNLPGATNTSCAIANIRALDAGRYSVVVSDATRSVPSFDAVLEVIPRPGNDAFADRFLISGLTNSATGSNAYASKEAGEPDHAGNPGGSSVWWTWTAPTNWSITLDTIGSDFDTLLAVYAGNSVSGLTEVASDFQSGGNYTNRFGTTITLSRLTFSPVAGASYQIAVDGYYGYAGNVVLNLRSAPPPANDTFENRAPIAGLTNSTTGNNQGATKEPGEPNHAGGAGGKSVWWTWTAPTNGTVTVETVGSSFDTLLAVYTGNSVSDLTLAAEDDESGTNHTSKLSFLGVAGRAYQIAVDGYGAAVGDILLSLRQVPASTAQPPEITFKGNWPGFRGGRALGVQVVGALAYVAIGEGGLLILDVSDPRNPVRVGSYDTPGEARNVTIDDGFAYVADGRAGFQIIDVHNPAIPNFAGEYNSLTNVNRVEVREHIAFVADGSDGLHAFDINDRLRPVLLDSVPGRALSLAVDGNNAYVCQGSDGLQIVNIQDPHNLRSASRYESVFALDVAVEKGCAFVCNWLYLTVIAVTNASAPTLVASEPLTSNPWDGASRNLFVIGNQAYICLPREYGGTKLVQVDISDPMAPQSIRTFLFNSQDPHEIAVSDGYAFLAGAEEGLEILNLGTPRSSPDRFDTASKPVGLAVQGNFAYLASGARGLQIVDISNPAFPRLAGNTTGTVFTVAVAGAQAVVGTGMKTLATIDISDPRAPKYQSSTDTSMIVGLFAQGDRAYALAGDALCPPLACTPEEMFRLAPTDLLYIFDLADRSNPILLRTERSSDLGFSGRDFSVLGRVAYLQGRYGDDLAILDFERPGQRFGQPTDVAGSAIDVANNTLAIGGTDGVELFDITYPAKPSLRARLRNSVTDLALDGKRAVLLNKDRGLEVIDLSDWNNPAQIGSSSSTGYERISLAGNYAVIAHGDQGLTILDLGPSFAAAPTISFQPQSRRVLPGDTVRFDVGASGTVPLSYQWLFNTTNTIPGATDFALVLTNVQAADAGQYSVVIENSIGTHVSASAVLSVDAAPSVVLTTRASDEGAAANPAVKYAVAPPANTFDRTMGIGIKGTPGRVCQIESTPSLLAPTHWSPVTVFTLPNSDWFWVPGTVPVSSGNVFYRAKWLPDQ